MAAERVPRSVTNDVSQRWLTGQYIQPGLWKRAKEVEPPYSSASRHYPQMDRYTDAQESRSLLEDGRDRQKSDAPDVYLLKLAYVNSVGRPLMWNNADNAPELMPGPTFRGGCSCSPPGSGGDGDSSLGGGGDGEVPSAAPKRK